jgi:hypothetical protein
MLTFLKRSLAFRGLKAGDKKQATTDRNQILDEGDRKIGQLSGLGEGTADAKSGKGSGNGSDDSGYKAQGQWRRGRRLKEPAHRGFQ